MKTILVLFIIWYQKPYGCMDTYLNERTQCRITFPDQLDPAYGLCVDLADNRFYRCLRGEPYTSTPGPEIP